MCFASGKMALRVRMNLLAQGFDFLPRRRDPLPHSGWRSTANNIMYRQDRSRLKALVKTLVEHGVQSLQFIQRQILQLTILFQAKLYGLADLLVRESRWNAALDEVSRGRPCVHESRLRGLIHARVVELNCFHPPRD